jgi:hypothetical protein
MGASKKAVVVGAAAEGLTHSTAQELVGTQREIFNMAFGLDGGRGGAPHQQPQTNNGGSSAARAW